MPLIKSYKKKILDVHDRKLFESQLATIKLQNSTLENNEMKTRILRRDLRHYLLIIDTLLQNGEYDDLNDIDIEHGIGSHSIQRFAKRNNIILDYEVTKISDTLYNFILRAYFKAKLPQTK